MPQLFEANSHVARTMRVMGFQEMIKPCQTMSG